MIEKFYFDTAIWIDYYEDRKGYNLEPLGDYVFKLLVLIKSGNKRLILTDFLLRELELAYSLEKINGMIKPFEEVIEKIIVKPVQKNEAEQISKERSVPRGDVLHAIISRDNNLILVARDKHFQKLKDISISKKPEEII